MAKIILLKFTVHARSGARSCSGQ